MADTVTDRIKQNWAIALVGMIVSAAVLWSLLTVEYDKCNEDEECITIAYTVKDTYLIWEKNPQHLADKMSALTGITVEIYPVSDEIAAIEAVDKGFADIAFVDGAAGWLSWEVYDLGVLAAEKKADGRLYYNATAWVRADSDIASAYLDGDNSTDPFSLMEGKVSCHTGWLKSAGMLIPMGFLIGNNYTEVVGNPNEIDSLRSTVTNFFSEDSSIPEGGTIYSSYKGALRCLSDGTGDVALVKDSVIDSYCSGPERYSWCLDVDEYVMLPAFGQAPSHPVIYNPSTMEDSQVTLIQNALLELDDDAEGREILQDVLNTDGMAITNAEDHLGTYGEAVGNVPGIKAFFS